MERAPGSEREDEIIGVHVFDPAFTLTPTSPRALLATALLPAPLHVGEAVHRALQTFHLARWRGQDDSVETVTSPI